ncbi:hypothetical protein [Asticcacaulis sp.]|uniref:hypothetical protein n=1 Tax=Asticcacaulis sp. TaxID=1872648 RepID=UPI00391B4DB0
MIRTVTFIRPQPTAATFQITTRHRSVVHAVVSGAACLLFFGAIIGALGVL